MGTDGDENSMNEVILQHFMMPSNIVKGTESLYCRSEGTFFPVILSQGEMLDLRTHFNMVHIRALRDFGIAKIQIRMEIDGGAFLSIFVDDEKEPFLNKRITNSGISLDIPSGDLLGIAITAGDGGCQVNGGKISCYSDKDTDIHLGLVICTYHREKIVAQKIHEITKFMKKNNFDNQIEIIVVDNGGTLDVRGVKVIHSDNLGGSAGFARGMIEAKKNGCTHIALNDDDALFDSEVLFRTISLLKIMKEDKIIGGTMLSFDGPYIVYESGAVCDRTEIRSLKKGIDISTIEGNVSLSVKEKIGHTGWWYSVFPVSLIEKIGYPLPFFYKGDDIEYGLRSNIEKIAVCGISIWHPEPRYSPSVNYYYIRNHLATLATHGMLNHKSIKAFVSKILLEISAYRYQSAEMMILGVKDFLKGPDYVYSKCKEGPISVNTEYQSLCELKKDDDYSSEPPKRSYFLRLITMNGLFLPSKGNTEKNVRCMETKDFYRMGKILYSVDGSEGFVAVRKRSRTISLVFRTMILHLQACFRVRKMCKDYSNKLMEYSSEAKWMGFYFHR